MFQTEDPRPAEGGERRQRGPSCAAPVRHPPASSPRTAASRSSQRAARSESAPYGNVVYISDARPAIGVSVHPACNMKVRTSGLCGKSRSVLGVPGWLWIVHTGPGARFAMP